MGKVSEFEFREQISNSYRFNYIFLKEMKETNEFKLLVSSLIRNIIIKYIKVNNTFIYQYKQLTDFRLKRKVRLHVLDPRD